MSPKDFTQSSGNVFADMGLEDAEGLLTRAQLGQAVRRIFEEQGATQAEIAKKLEIDQAEVSKLMSGKYHLFSEKRLFGFLDKLNKQVILTVVDRPENEPSSVVIHD